MSVVEATPEFAKEVAAKKVLMPCGLKPDSSNGKCHDIRIPAGLVTIKRGYATYLQNSLENVPLVCMHCVGARTGKFEREDLLVKQK